MEGSLLYSTVFVSAIQNMNQPQVYIHPLPLEPPSHLPVHPPPLGYSRAHCELPVSYSKHLLATLHTGMYMFPCCSKREMQRHTLRREGQVMTEAEAGETRAVTKERLESLVAEVAGQTVLLELSEQTRSCDSLISGLQNGEIAHCWCHKPSWQQPSEMDTQDDLEKGNRG